MSAGAAIEGNMFAGRAKRGIVKEIRQTGLPLGTSCKNTTAVVPEAEDLIRGSHKDRGAYGVDK